jgi:hypothetical protein
MTLLFEGKVFNTKGIQTFQCISIYFLMEIERGTGRDRCLQMPMSVEQCNILLTFTGGGASLESRLEQRLSNRDLTAKEKFWDSPSNATVPFHILPISIHSHPTPQRHALELTGRFLRNRH